LEQHSQTEDSTRSREILEDQLRECFGRAVYSHKTHEKCADILLARGHSLRLFQIALSAITTAGFVSVFFGSGNTGAAIGACVSTVLLCINAYMKNYDLADLAQKHRQAASEIWLVREQMLSLLVDLKMGQRPIEQLQSCRDKLTSQLHKAYGKAPSTTAKAYKEAQMALKYSEELSFGADELDSLLPASLRRHTA